MKKLVIVLVCILVPVAFAVIAFFIGDFAIKHSNMVRPKDFIENRIGLPFVGLIVSIVPTARLVDFVESWDIWKRKNKPDATV